MTTAQEIKPNKGCIKRQLVPHKPGWWIGEADYAQIELRIAALVSQDELMLRCFNEGVDMHRLLASRAFPVSQRVRDSVTAYIKDRGVGAAEVNAILKEAISKEQRTDSKGINFGFIYGIGAVAVNKKYPQISLDQAKRFLRECNDLYRDYVAWAKSMERVVREEGVITSLFGHRRHMENFSIAEPDRQAEMIRQAVNFPIQCTASNLTIYAGMWADQIIQERGYQTRLIGQVHDSIWATGPQEEKIPALRLLQDVMEHMPFDWLYGKDPRFPRGVPIVAEVKTGPNLADLEEFNPRAA